MAAGITLPPFYFCFVTVLHGFISRQEFTAALLHMGEYVMQVTEAKYILAR